MSQTPVKNQSIVFGNAAANPGAQKFADNANKRIVKIQNTLLKRYNIKALPPSGAYVALGNNFPAFVLGLNLPFAVKERLLSQYQNAVLKMLLDWGKFLRQQAALAKQAQNKKRQQLIVQQSRYIKEALQITRKQGLACQKLLQEQRLLAPGSFSQDQFDKAPTSAKQAFLLASQSNANQPKPSKPKIIKIFSKYLKIFSKYLKT